MCITITISIEHDELLKILNKHYGVCGFSVLRIAEKKTYGGGAPELVLVLLKHNKKVMQRRRKEVKKK